MIEKQRDIDPILLYIEENLPNDLYPENIAERHFISLSRLYRDFSKRQSAQIKTVFAC